GSARSARVRGVPQGPRRGTADRPGPCCGHPHAVRSFVPCPRVRVPLDLSLSPEQVLLALRDEPWPFALVGRWAGGGAIVGCAPTRLLAPGDDPFTRLEDLPEPDGDALVGGGW